MNKNMKMTKAQLQEFYLLIDLRQAKAENFIEACKGETNPQIISSVNEMKGEKHMCEAIMLYLKGDKYVLKILAGN